jgi:hypothetical protein
MDALQQRDHACFADALPGQAQHEGVELRPAQRERAADILAARRSGRCSAPGCQPHADAVVHEHLHAVGPPVGEQVRMVRPRRAEHRDHARQRRSVPARMSSGSTANHIASTRITAAARAARPGFAGRLRLAGNNVVYDWTHIRRLVQPIHWENL